MMVDEIETLHLDRGYDYYPKTRRQLARYGLDDLDIQHRATRGATPKQPLRLGRRWVVEGTNSWLSNYGQLRRNTYRYFVNRIAVTRRRVHTSRRRTGRASRTTRALLFIADSDVRLRDVAATEGITERAAQHIVQQLEEGGFLERERAGRRNCYPLHAELALRHPTDREHQVRELLAVFGATPLPDRARSRRRA